MHNLQLSLEVESLIVGTLSNTTPSTGRGSQFFQMISLLPGIIETDDNVDIAHPTTSHGIWRFIPL